MNGRVYDVYTKDQTEKIEREQAQKLPGKKKLRAKFGKKRGVWVGKAFAPSHLANQQTLPVQGGSQGKALRASVCTAPAGRPPSVQAKRETSQPPSQHGFDKWPKKRTSTVEGDLFQGKKKKTL